MTTDRPRFKRGDVVRLRSGGEPMTVEEHRDRIVPAEVDVTWRSPDGARHRHTIPADLLVHVDAVTMSDR